MRMTIFAASFRQCNSVKEAAIAAVTASGPSPPPAAIEVEISQYTPEAFWRLERLKVMMIRTSQALEIGLDICDVGWEWMKLVDIGVILRWMIAVVDDLWANGFDQLIAYLWWDIKYRYVGQEPRTATLRSSGPPKPSSPLIMSHIPAMWSLTELMYFCIEPVQSRMKARSLLNDGSATPPQPELSNCWIQTQGIVLISKLIPKSDHCQWTVHNGEIMTYIDFPFLGPIPVGVDWSYETWYDVTGGAGGSWAGGV